MQLKTICLATAALFLLSSCTTNYTLKFDPKPGAKYEVQMITASTTGQEAMGQKMEMNSVTEMNMRYEISKSEGDSREMKVTFESMKTSQKANGQEMNMDTNSADSSNAGTSMLKAMMGSEFLITINSKGEIASVKGMDALVAKVMAASQATDTAMRDQVAAGVNNFMSDDILKSMMEQSLKIFPDKAVKEGDKWEKDMAITKPLPMNIATTYTLKRVAANTAKLDVASTITPGKGGMQMMGMTIETELNGTQTGTMDVDAETGMILASEIKQNIGGKLKVMGQEIPMTVNAVITVKAKKI